MNWIKGCGEVQVNSVYSSSLHVYHVIITAKLWSILQCNMHYTAIDYREVPYSTPLFLGADCSGDVHVQAPETFHRARQMSKLTDSLQWAVVKHIFCSQYRLTAHKLASLGLFNTFEIKVYLKAWFTCACTLTAPKNDQHLLRELEDYKETHEGIAEAAIKSFSGHLQYLSEIVVGLAEVKSAIVKVLSRKQPIIIDEFFHPTVSQCQNTPSSFSQHWIYHNTLW